VTAEGIILEVTQKSYPDLYWALRGGGNNFGIVTRLDLFTFPQGNIWGGSKVYTIDQSPALFKAFYDMNANPNVDPYAALWLAFAYVGAAGGWFGSGEYVYTKPEADPPVFDEFKAITPIQSSMSITSLTNLTIAVNASNPGGFRYVVPKNSRASSLLYRI